MSYVYPGVKFTGERTQAIALSGLISSIDVWATNGNLGVAGAPTYKSSNDTAAYFKFLKMQDGNFGDNDVNEFVESPDFPKFQDLRKYMIVLSNILLAEYRSLDLVARQIDFMSICDYDGHHEDLKKSVKKWADEIDPNHDQNLIELCVNVDGVVYPIAFYSPYTKSGMRIYPFNTINEVARKKLMGWDNEKGFIFETFASDLSVLSGANRALYAALNDVEANLTNINAVKALSRWLAKNYEGDVVQANGAAHSFEKKTLFITGTAETIDLPICAGPIDVQNMFSDQLLIIKSNANVSNNEYGFCKLNNLEIGITEQEAPNHAVIPPLSDELMEKIRESSSGVDFSHCTVNKEGGSYHVVIYLTIDGAEYNWKHIYPAGDVRKCDNFPLISVLSGNGAPTPARLHCCYYNPTNEVPSNYLDGSEILLGARSDDAIHELQFDTPVTPNEFAFFGVRYHNALEGCTYSCGYLFFDRNRTLFDVANSASSTAIVIDDENNVAQIAVWNPETEVVNSYNVYNDRIFFFSKNGRNDFDSRNGQLWGEMNKTIFEVEGGSKYALAPFSREFADMIANGHIRISTAKLEPDGKNWKFSVKFEYDNREKETAPRVYRPEEQYVCSNPPFIHAVETVDKVTGQQGYDVVLVQNMRSSYHGTQSTVDSNDLIFRMNDKDLNKINLFVPQSNTAYIQILGSVLESSSYYGQIALPLDQYKLGQGFHALKDESSGCAAILLVNDMGRTQPKQIITGRVFDDSLFLVAKENSRRDSVEYRAWRNSGLFIPVDEMPRESDDDREYEAIFPFSLKMLQNLKANNLMLSKGHKPIVQYVRDEKCYQVSVFIDKGDGGVDEEFTMSYRESAVVKCDNLPFIIPLLDNVGKSYLARFNNEQHQVARQNADGSTMIIEYVGDGQTDEILPAATVSVSSDRVVLKLIAQKDNVQYICHVLYQMKDTVGEGVYAVQSKATGAQHIFDFKDTVVREITVFTDYMMWTPVQSDRFANGTQCQAVGTGNRRDMRVYSIPITMEFSQLMKERNLQIASYSHVKYYTDPMDPESGMKDADTSEFLYVEISLTGLGGISSKIMKKFPKNHVLNFEVYPLPTLTVFPFVNFVADNSYGELAGKSLWQQYSYAKFTPEEQVPEKAANRRKEAPLGSRVEFWLNGKKAEFEARSTMIMDAVIEDKDKTRMEIAKIKGWGQYIHMKYDGSNRIAPNHAVDSAWDGQELGCIIMKPAEPTRVSKGMKATVGVDFGTRNSMIAIQTEQMTDVIFPFHGTTNLQQIIIPGMQDAAFTDFTNLSYIPHFGPHGKINKPGCGKFASTTMVYSCAKDSKETLIPYDLGFVPNVQGNVLKRIMQRMGEEGSMGDVLGFYSDLKISTSGDSHLIAIMKRNVRLFIKSIMFHSVLNCYQAGCGQIKIRISMPSEQFKASNKEVWNEAKAYIEDGFIPPDTLTIGEYATEAKALFTYVQSKMREKGAGGMSKYSAITDGGDGTYDFTINKLINGSLSEPDKDMVFSLRYAGQQIMTDSVNTFYDYLVCRENGIHSANVKSIFKGMWNVGDGSRQTTLDDLVNQLSNYRASGQNDHEKEKTLVLMLVEQFGIDHHKLVNPSAKNFMQKTMPEYQNFVRMVQYKFLFLFNILGEQVRKNIHFEEEDETRFTIFLYGGTAQALTIAEPYCNGNLQLFGSQQYSAKLPMVMFINSMMNLPKNRNGEEIKLRFIPAPDAEKREIASGLIKIRDDQLKNYNNAEANNILTSKNDFEVGNDNQTADDLFGGIDLGFGGFGDSDFGGSGFGDFGGNGNDASNEEAARNERKPRTVDEFIDDLKSTLNSRTMALPKGVYSIDRFLPFLDENGKAICLSEILDDIIVRNALGGDLTTLWDDVLSENQDIDDPDLLYHIYTLKMVGLAIETYLRK